MVFLWTSPKFFSIKINTYAFDSFIGILNRCGISTSSNLPQSPDNLSSQPIFHPFLPLFTPHFHFHNQQLTLLGDTVIDDYLSAALLDYGAHSGLIMSVNTAKQLNAIFHNHFTLRLFARELKLDELATPVTHPREDDDEILNFLDDQVPLVREKDTAGTSFQVSLLPEGQSPLGWKMSHFIGSIHLAFGPTASMNALEYLYDLKNTGNIIGRASALLQRTLEFFPAMNVAGAILAAQGIPVRFVGKTRLLPDQPANDHDGPRKASSHVDRENETNESSEMVQSTGSTGCRDDPPNTTRSEKSPNALMVALCGFGTKRAPEHLSLDEIVSSKNAREVLAAGPGVVDYVEIWRQRTAELVKRELEPAPESALEDGWLTTAEQQSYKKGPAFSGKVDFSLFRSFADAYGHTQPIDGKWVGKKKFKKPVRDPLFYDKRTDMRNGVPFSTDGEPLQDYLERFDHPHERLFEVTMLTGMYEERVLGRAIASHYTVARELVCRAYLGGVMNDLSMFLNRQESFDAK